MSNFNIKYFNTKEEFKKMANVTLPVLEVNFKQLLATFIERSERGIAILIVRDDTDKSYNYKKYVEQEDLDKDKALYTNDNFQYLSDVISFGSLNYRL